MFDRLARMLITSLILAGPAAAGGSGWLDDYEDAVKKAERAGLPIVAEFTRSDACETCQTLDKEILRGKEFRKWSKKNAVLLTVDFPEKKFQSSKTKERNEELKSRFEVEEFPTVLVLSSGGALVGRLGYDGEQDASEWMTKLTELADGAMEAGGWLDDFEKAKKLSRATGRPILADFTGSDWCSWCIKLKKEVFDTDEFRQWAREEVVLLELDFPRRTELPAAVKEQNEKLRDEYQIKGYPTVLFLDHKGKVLGKYGYDEGGPENWIENAEKKMK